VFFLLVAGGNFKGVWLARAIGEAPYLDLLRQAAREGKERDFAVAISGHALMFSAFGALLLLFYRDTDTWGYFAAQGVLLYAFAVFLHTCLFYRRLKKAVPPAV
jgi:predicted lysophospholipase L1 biosynthesis ABC-type transport system permease subunit